MNVRMAHGAKRIAKKLSVGALRYALCALRSIIPLTFIPSGPLDKLGICDRGGEEDIPDGY